VTKAIAKFNHRVIYKEASCVAARHGSEDAAIDLFTVSFVSYNYLYAYLHIRLVLSLDTWPMPWIHLLKKQSGAQRIEQSQLGIHESIFHKAFPMILLSTQCFILKMY
jgi:hypothetical protein